MIKPRSIKIKAWNIEDKLMKRVRQVDCVKSELYKEGHILLQYTGMDDENNVEIYDGDVLLYQHRKHLVTWNDTDHEWIWTDLDIQKRRKVTSIETIQSVRLCHYFESSDFSATD